MVKIVEKYFDPGNFAGREREVLEAVCKETGFEPQREIFRGSIYDASKLGSVILRGNWQGKQAVLKLQGLNVEVDEVDTLKRLAEFFSGTRLHVPEVFVSSPWNAERQYGYHIMEDVGDQPIFAMPDPSKADQIRFAQFWQVYQDRLRFIKPWIARPKESIYEFGMSRLNHWKKIRESKAGNDPSEYTAELARFDKIARRFFGEVPMVFCHGHLTANDVLIRSNQYVILSNLYWTWRPQLYDTVFVIWACLVRMNRRSDTPEKAIAMIESWFEAYYQQQSFRALPNVRRQFYLLMLERLIGILLADLALHDKFRVGAGVQHRRKLLEVNKGVFAHIATQLESEL